MDSSGNPYDYTTAGFDGFLSRSVDNTPRINLAAQGPNSTAIRYDASQVSGSLGNTLQIGGILIDGVSGRISIYSDDNEVVRIGNLDD
jgi:hypothetical protein